MHLSENTKVLLDDLVRSQVANNNQITSIRDANPAQKKVLQTALSDFHSVKGRPLFYPYVSSGRGQGPFVELVDGSIKMDFINGIGVNILGHSHLEVLKAAVKGALSDVVVQGNLQPSNIALEYAQKILKPISHNSSLKHIWFCSSGAMANENALKMCRQYKKGARKIIAMRGAFAGRTTMMAEITDNPAYKKGLPTYDDVLRISFTRNTSYQNCLENKCSCSEDSKKSFLELKQAHQKEAENIGAFMVELVQGEGGFKIGCKKFWEPLFIYCKENDIPVFVDEVQSFMRTSSFFAFETFGLSKYVDICTIAKSAQIGATLYSEKLNPQPGLVAGTFAGSNVAFEGGVAIFDWMASNAFGESSRNMHIHNQCKKALSELSETSCVEKIHSFGGIGLMFSFVVFDGSAEKRNLFIKKLFENHLIAFGCGSQPFRVRFLLPAILSEDHIHLMKKIVEKTLLEMS